MLHLSSFLSQSVNIESKITNWEKYIEKSFIEYYIWREFNKNVLVLTYEEVD